MTVPSDPIAAVGHPDPYPYYRRLAVERPLHRDDRLGLWVAASAAAVTDVLTLEACRVRPPAEPVPGPLVGTPAGDVFRHLVRMNDGAMHHRLKPSLEAVLKQQDAEAVAQVTAELASGVAERSGTAAVDWAMFALPAAVVAALLGVPPSALAAAVEWTAAFARCVAPGAAAAELERGTTAAAALVGLMQSLPPGDGLLVRLRNAVHGDGCGDGIADGRLIANAVGLLSQTCDATAGLIGNALVALARQPRLWRQVAAEPGLLPAVLGEVLRHDPPVQNTRRFVAEAVTIAGHELAPGDAVLVLLAAANHDAAVNPQPARFDIARPSRRVFTFGVGRHACPGETIAVAIAATALRCLMPCIKDPASLAEPVRYRASANSRIPRFA